MPSPIAKRLFDIGFLAGRVGFIAGRSANPASPGPARTSPESGSDTGCRRDSFRLVVWGEFAGRLMSGMVISGVCSCGPDNKIWTGDAFRFQAGSQGRGARRADPVAHFSAAGRNVSLLSELVSQSKTISKINSGGALCVKIFCQWQCRR
jgi:hypothetical protein